MRPNLDMRQQRHRPETNRKNKTGAPLIGIKHRTSRKCPRIQTVHIYSIFKLGKTASLPAKIVGCSMIEAAPRALRPRKPSQFSTPAAATGLTICGPVGEHPSLGGLPRAGKNSGVQNLRVGVVDFVRHSPDCLESCDTCHYDHGRGSQDVRIYVARPDPKLLQRFKYAYHEVKSQY
jgi:hypothetical protein